MSWQKQFFEKLSNDLERLFPKHKCKERGSALTLNAFANLYFREIISKAEGEAYERGRETEHSWQSVCGKCGKDIKDDFFYEKDAHDYFHWGCIGDGDDYKRGLERSAQLVKEKLKEAKKSLQTQVTQGVVLGLEDLAQTIRKLKDNA